jgi:hypothetical protein
MDFGYLTMDEIKLEAINDRLKKFDGNQTKAADSLQIHVNSISNILNRDAKPGSKAREITQAEFKRNDALVREGFKHDAESGLTVPVKVSAVPGIEKIAQETFNSAKKRQDANLAAEKKAGARPHAAAPGAPAAAAGTGAAAGSSSKKKK